jgi:hypothetical protein
MSILSSLISFEPKEKTTSQHWLSGWMATEENKNNSGEEGRTSDRGRVRGKKEEDSLEVMNAFEHKLEEKLREELDSQHPYEAMLYVQTFVARKRRSITHLHACQLIFKGLEILLEYSEDQYAATLYQWLLQQQFIDSEFLSIIFHKTLILISLNQQTKKPNKISEFILAIYTPLTAYLDSHLKGNSLEKTRYFYELNQKCGEMFEGTRRWCDAKNSYLNIGDITSVVRVTHHWAEDGYGTEYPLFFCRMYLSLLGNKLIPQAAAFFRSATDEYLDSYEFTRHNSTATVPPSSVNVTATHTIPTSSYSLWQMCILLNDLLGLLDTPALASKIDSAKIFTLALSRYETLLKYYDPALYDLMKVVGVRVFHVKEERNEQQMNNAAGPMAFMNKLLMGGGR